MSFLEVAAGDVVAGDELILSTFRHLWPSGELVVHKVSSEVVTSVGTAGGTTSIETAHRTQTSSADKPTVVDRV
jgi:hypothetical protein